MGFDVVHFLPLTAMGGSKSPYSVSDHFALDKSYQNPNNRSDDTSQLENILEEEGLSCCTDLVLNHVAFDGLVARNHSNWIQQYENGTFKHAGYELEGKWKEWGDLVLLNYYHPDDRTRKELWGYMFDYVRLWSSLAAQRKGIIRLDNLHSSHEGFVKFTLDKLHEEFPNLTILAELFTNQEHKERLSKHLGLDYLLATQWEYQNKFAPQLREYLQFLHNTHGVRHFLPITTHDSSTPSEEYGCVDSTVPRYAISVLFGMGAAGIVQGVEYGIPNRINFIGNNGSVKNKNPANFIEYFAKINEIGNNKVFHKKRNLKFIDNGHTAVLAAYRENKDPKDRFIIMANLDTENSQCLKIYPQSYDIHFNKKLMLGVVGCSSREDHVQFTLPPCGVHVIQLHPDNYISTLFEFVKSKKSVKTSICKQR